jgi:hypothetical protein
VFQFWLGSSGVAEVSAETADVSCAAVDALASGTGTATVSVTDVATVGIAVSDPTVALGAASAVPDVATVGSSVSDATPNELIQAVEEATGAVLVEDPIARLWPTANQRQSQTGDVLYERVHVGETRVRRHSPDEAPRPLRQQEAV